MKKIILGILIFGLFFIYFSTHPVSYSGGFDGGRVLRNCFGKEITIKTGKDYPDAIYSTTYCLGLTRSI
jgi:hypothetical protein